MSFTQQIGNPNATYPPSLTLAQSANGVGLVSIGSDVKYVTFNPIPSYSWIPLSTNPYENYFFEWYTGTDFTGDYYGGYTPDFATFNALNVRTLGLNYGEPRLSGIVNLDQYPNLDSLDFGYYDGNDISFLYNLPQNLYYLYLYDLPNVPNDQFTALLYSLSAYNYVYGVWFQTIGDQLKNITVQNTLLPVDILFLQHNYNLTNITLKNIQQLSSLQCNINQLTALDVQNLLQLQTLNAYYNQLSAITLQNLPLLQELQVNNNQLKHVDITGISAVYLSFVDNNLLLSAANHIAVQCDLGGKTSGQLYLNGGTNSPLSGIGITAANNLIAKGWAVTTNVRLSTTPYDAYPLIWYTGPNSTGEEYEMYTSEFFLINPTDVKTLSLISDQPKLSGIANLTPYTNITDLNIHNYDDTYLQLAHTTADNFHFQDALRLTFLQLIGCNTRNVHIQNTPQLLTLICQNSNISSITIQDTPQLQMFWVLYGNLKTIELQNLSALNQIALNDNQLTAVSLQNLPALTNLSVINNRLSAVTINQQTVTSMNFSYNHLTYVDITGLSPVYAFFNNNSLPLSAVNHIAARCDLGGQTNGMLHLNGGTNSPLSGAGITAKNNLLSKGWTVLSNP